MPKLNYCSGVSGSGPVLGKKEFFEGRELYELNIKSNGQTVLYNNCQNVNPLQAFQNWHAETR